MSMAPAYCKKCGAPMPPIMASMGGVCDNCRLGGTQANKAAEEREREMELVMAMKPSDIIAYDYDGGEELENKSNLFHFCAPKGGKWVFRLPRAVKLEFMNVSGEMYGLDGFNYSMKSWTIRSFDTPCEVGIFCAPGDMVREIGTSLDVTYAQIDQHLAQRREEDALAPEVADHLKQIREIEEEANKHRGLRERGFIE